MARARSAARSWARPRTSRCTSPRRRCRAWPPGGGYLDDCPPDPGRGPRRLATPLVQLQRLLPQRPDGGGHAGDLPALVPRVGRAIRPGRGGRRRPARRSGARRVPFLHVDDCELLLPGGSVRVAGGARLRGGTSPDRGRLRGGRPARRRPRVLAYAAVQRPGPLPVRCGGPPDVVRGLREVNGGEMTENGRLRVVNPATEESIEEIATTSREDPDRVAENPRRGFEEWRGFAGLDRAELFHEISANLRSHADELAEIMTREGGKPFIENRDEVTWTAACFDYYGEIARDNVGYLPAPIEAQQLALVIKEPVGTVACIVPWNYPLLLAAWKVAPALAAGNAVILKPSEETPLATRRMAELVEGLLPDGLLGVVYGAAGVGEALVRHEQVDMVAFTGSQETGRKVGQVAAERLIRTNLELGGKDPFIVCDDVDDVEVAAQGAVWAACLNEGQVCTSAERFYVMKGVVDDFVEAAKSFVEELKIGDPMDRATDIGPLINEGGRRRVERHVGEALEGGAELVTGGERWGERGFFYRPTVLLGARPSMRVMREETFGPVVPTVEVGSLDEAIALANSVPYALGANVYTEDFEKMLRCMRGLRAGTVWINDPLTDNDAAPFGGQRGSGIGRELGREGLEAFQESKHVHIDPRVEKKEWWYPYGNDDDPAQRTM